MLREEYLNIASKCNTYKQLVIEMNRRINCAYLFEGEDIILSKSVAALLACECAKNPENAKQKLLSGNLVDVKIFGEDGLRKEDAEKIIEESQRSPVELSMLYFILDFTNANETVQNKLLKTLEDIPNKCVFFVISSTPKDTLFTIKSRCKTFYPIVSEKEMSNMITIENNPMVKCFGKTLTLYDFIKYGNGEKIIGISVSYLNYLGTPSGEIKAISLIPKDREGFITHFLYVELILGMILSQNNGNTIDTYGVFDIFSLGKKFNEISIPKATKIIREGIKRAIDGNITSLTDLITLKLTEVIKNV